MPDSPDATLNEDVLKFIRWSANTREDTTENIGVARDLLARIKAAALPAAPAGLDAERLNRAAYRTPMQPEESMKEWLYRVAAAYAEGEPE